MKHLFIILLSMVVLNRTHAQLYINGDMTIQNGVTLYADDTIQLASGSAITTNGILQSTKGINTNQKVINTGTTGFITTPIPSGVTKTYDIGTSNNNKIAVLHNSVGAVNYQLAVRDNVYINPQTNATVITTNAVNKTWMVQPLSNSTNNTIGLYWNVTDELSGFNRSVSGMSKWQSGVTSAWAFVNGTSAATLTGSTPAYAKTVVVGNMNTGTYYFGVGGNGSSLPVKLVLFDAFKTNDDVQVNWETVSEINSSHFELERSSDGISFQLISSKKAAGNSNAKLQYTYTDKMPFVLAQTNKLYYRLKAVDLDGTFTYSGIKEVAINNDGISFSIYPNPNNGEFIIQSNKLGNYQIINELGQTVKQFDLNNTNSSTINMENISSGVYFIIGNNCKQKMVVIK